MRILLFIAALVTGIGLTGCDVEQTEEGEMPEVDVEAEAGNLPEYDVDWADVEVGTRTEMIEVPKVVVVMEKEEVEVPYLNLEMPEAGDTEMEERTLQVEAEVANTMKEINIVEVYAVGNELFVIASLEDTGQELQDETVRISDQLIINAPEDLNVRYYIIGERPEGDFNKQYRYIGDRSAIADRLQNGKQIYS